MSERRYCVACGGACRGHPAPSSPSPDAGSETRCENCEHAAHHGERCSECWNRIIREIPGSTPPCHNSPVSSPASERPLGVDQEGSTARTGSTLDAFRGILAGYTRVGPESDAERIEWLEARGVASIYLRDGRQINPASMSLRAAIDAAQGSLAGAPVPAVDPSWSTPQAGEPSPDLAALRAKYELLRDAVNDSVPECPCDPGCDSYGHTETCKYVDAAAWMEAQQAKIRSLQAEQARAAREIAKWREIGGPVRTKTVQDQLAREESARASLRGEPTTTETTDG